MAQDVGIQKTIRVGEPVTAAKERFLSWFTVWMGGGGFAPQPAAVDSVVFGRRSFHTWQIVVAILLFPIGLVALIAEKRYQWAQATFAPEGETTSVISVTGALELNAARQLQEELAKYDPASRS
jgi:hypothetical protein